MAKTVRFHIKTGPPSLFERVLFKMQGRRELRLEGAHLQARADERGAPLDEIRIFDSGQWELRTAEVNPRSGKFQNSAWTRTIEGKRWWIVIGNEDILMTVIDTDKFGLGEGVVKAGSFFEHVENINRELMASVR